ncbi:MAG: LPS export ABC transporter periplasmic protein LptC [Ignavibacteria bacterium RBG_13_36_8]|nr:MAG: LPS export ABC transporter periplasmic protein LptC [Ignavibacteria bacterium RBG_13_36_8]
MKKFVISILILMFYCGCGEEKIEPQIDHTVDEEEIPNQESWNAEIFLTEEGKLRAIVFADHLKKYDSRKMTYLEGMKVDFYNQEEEKTSTLTAKFGRVNDDTRDMFAIDSVVAVSDSGTTLTTDELMWRNRDKKISTDKFVTLISKTEKIEGFGFESDQRLENYIIYNITYTTNLKEDESK